MLLAGLAALVVSLALGLAFAGTGGGSVFDRAAASLIEVDPSRQSRVYFAFGTYQSLADPLPAGIFVLVLVLLCLILGRRRLAVLALVGPALADATAIIAKHLVRRTIHGSLSYPSTHCTQTAAVAMVLALLISSVFRLKPRSSIVVVLVISVVAGLAMGWALVAGDVHWTTDTIGGLCLGLAVTPAAAWCLDRVADRLHRPR